MTGRHYELVLEAISEHELPVPQWMICDVGASIYEAVEAQPHQSNEAYQTHLQSIIGSFTVERLKTALSRVAKIRLQEPEKQRPFKLSYYCLATDVGELSKQIVSMLEEFDAPYRVIASVDPFTGDGLIDLLPKGVSKDSALRWWVKRTGRQMTDVVFAGDSGNDLAALSAGYRSILVGNADRSIAHEASAAHQASGWENRLYLAQKSATSGVLEGLLHYLGETG